MMKRLNQFAHVAQEAYRLILEESESPEAAWRQAAVLILKSSSTVEKPCPRQVFLGLCGEGMLKGIAKRSGSHNKHYGYARWVIRVWLRDPDLGISEVWALAQKAGNFKEKHNGQADVVAGLWDYLDLSGF